MHVAELLVSHGASLNAKTFVEETPIGIFTLLSIGKTRRPQQELISCLFYQFKFVLFPTLWNADNLRDNNNNNC